MRSLINIGIIALFIYLMFNIFVIAAPIIIIFIAIRVLLSIFGVKKQRKTYYYRYNGQNNEEFNEFFRNAGFGGYQQGRQNSSGYGSYGSNPYFEDKSRYYSVLGVEQSATQEEIKKAYRTKAREYHPDKHAQSSEQVKLEAEKRFKEINEAYDKLKD